MNSCGSGLAWLLGTHSGTCRMPPLSSPHLNKYLLSTCCQSGIKGQGSVLLPLGLTQLGHWGGVRYFSKRIVCTALRPPVWGPPVPLKQLAGATGREPSLQGAVHGAQ